MPLTVGSLFAGIGGFDLGLERAGMRTVWQVEKNDYARKVLAKHWPDVRRHDDVCTFPPGDPNDWRCDLICGGFPCQDISLAGRGAGIEGERSSLWFEFARVLRLLRPRYVIVENVAALLVRGMDTVLGELASLGFDAEWSVFPTCSLGAPHTRERLFLVAYSNSFDGIQGLGDNRHQSTRLFAGDSGPVPDHWMGTPPFADRVADGVPDGMERRRVLGNAVSPQLAEFIGRRIVEHAGHVEFAR